MEILLLVLSAVLGGTLLIARRLAACPRRTPIAGLLRNVRDLPPRPPRNRTFEHDGR